MTTKHKKRGSCKHGKLKTPVRTNNGGKRRCKKSRIKKSKKRNSKSSKKRVKRRKKECKILKTTYPSKMLT